MKFKFFLIQISLLISFTSFSSPSNDIATILVEIPGGKVSDAGTIAVKRIREQTNAVTNVSYTTVPNNSRAKFDLIIILGTPEHSPEIQNQWKENWQHQ